MKTHVSWYLETNLYVMGDWIQNQAGRGKDALFVYVALDRATLSSGMALFTY